MRVSQTAHFRSPTRPSAQFDQKMHPLVHLPLHSRMFLPSNEEDWEDPSSPSLMRDWLWKRGNTVSTNGAHVQLIVWLKRSGRVASIIIRQNGLFSSLLPSTSVLPRTASWPRHGNRCSRSRIGTEHWSGTVHQRYGSGYCKQFTQYWLVPERECNGQTTIVPHRPRNCWTTATAAVAARAATTESRPGCIRPRPSGSYTADTATEVRLSHK